MTEMGVAFKHFLTPKSVQSFTPIRKVIQLQARSYPHKLERQNLAGDSVVRLSRVLITRCRRQTLMGVGPQIIKLQPDSVNGRQNAPPICAMLVNRTAVLLFILAWTGTSRAASLEIRLLTPLSSYWSKPGDKLSAVTVEPIEGRTGAVPPGCIVTGKVTASLRVGLGLVRETATLKLEFTEVRLPDGRSYPIETRITDVPNARERVNRRGAIRGIRATASL